MKIIRAWIDDPTEVGLMKPPSLAVMTDCYPDPTHDVLTGPDRWWQQKYGPFVMYNYNDEGAGGDIDAGDYNIVFAGQYPAIIDINLLVGNPGEHIKQWSGVFGLPIPRARQLVRKHCPQWRICLSDKDAIDGAMLWVPQKYVPLCRFWHSAARMTCDAPAVASVRKSGIDFPLCDLHLKDHNTERAEARRASTSK